MPETPSSPGVDDPLLRNVAHIARRARAACDDLDRAVVGAYGRGFTEHEIGAAIGLSPVDVTEIVVRARARAQREAADPA